MGEEESRKGRKGKDRGGGIRTEKENGGRRIGGRWRSGDEGRGRKRKVEIEEGRIRQKEDVRGRWMTGEEEGWRRKMEDGV